MTIHTHTTYEAECCFCGRRQEASGEEYPAEWFLVTTISFGAEGRYVEPTEFAACGACNDRIFQPALDARRFK